LHRRQAIILSPSHCIIAKPLHRCQAITLSPSHRVVIKPPDRRPQLN